MEAKQTFMEETFTSSMEAKTACFHASSYNKWNNVVDPSNITKLAALGISRGGMFLLFELTHRSALHLPPCRAKYAWDFVLRGVWCIACYTRTAYEIILGSYIHAHRVQFLRRVETRQPEAIVDINRTFSIAIPVAVTIGTLQKLVAIAPFE